ncbi:hypothetical protein [Saccharibacillus endophyticus]|uniref:Uncharacterized protein n=1 Tax=Saccharibacillus endophyticus TaxID=2060666 RepID=A0ABQ2A7Z0_9BACL|nr:hypothetical protein [Saccharibacillus endophyticus]GGH86456.1 hypothetical protein GCM10007362_46270 [Saccharibacillus endophyticus]
MSSIQGRMGSISPIGGLTALNTSYTPSRHGKAPLESRKVSLEAELSRVLQLPASVADRDQRAMRIRRHIALLERHIALLDAANGERAEFTVQGRPEHEHSEQEQQKEQPVFALPEEEKEEPAQTASANRVPAPKGGDDYARAMLGSFDSPGSLYSAPSAPGAVQPWENRSETTRAAKVGRNFDVSI